jgi:hypothetical protein
MCVEHVRRSDRVQLCESHHSKFNGYENTGALQSDLNGIPLNLDSLQDKCSDKIQEYYRTRGKNSRSSTNHSNSNSGGNISSNMSDEYGGRSEGPSRSGLDLVRSLSRARRGRRGSDGSNCNRNSNNDTNSGSGGRRGGAAEGGSSSSPKVNCTEHSNIPSSITNSTPHGVLTFREYVTVSMIGR